MSETEAAPEVPVEAEAEMSPFFTPDGSEMRWKYNLYGYASVECEGRPQRIRPTKAEVRLFHDDESGPSWEIHVIGLPVTRHDEDAARRHPCAITNHRFRQGLLVDLIIDIRKHFAKKLPPPPPKPLDTEEDQAMRGLKMVYGDDLNKWPKDTIKLARERGLLRQEEA